MAVIREWANQMVFLASILAGFSVSTAVALISGGSKRRVVIASIAAFMLATGLLLAVTAVGSSIITRSEVWQQTPQVLGRLRAVRGIVGNLLLAGLGLFLSGLALAGWMHSRAVGVMATLTAALTAVLVLWLNRALP